MEMCSKPFRCISEAILQILAGAEGQLIRQLIKATTNCSHRMAEKSLKQGKWSHLLENQYIEEKWVKTVQEEPLAELVLRVKW